MLISTNDKTIKLWKVFEKTVKGVSDIQVGHSAKPVLKLPNMVITDAFIAAQPKRTFSNAHTYHINSISVNSDGETFLSADDLRINLWNMHVTDQSFSIIIPAESY
jgi:serine/threonine-protein phosphatase 2A regulatory subunit B